MLYTEESVRAVVRNREGKRVIYLGPEDRLTPSARDWLRAEGITALTEEERQRVYTTPLGGSFTEKPEGMTHLHGNVLVPKTHPRIDLRGRMDALEAELLLCQHASQSRAELSDALGQMLDYVRKLLRAEVLGEPIAEARLCGLSAAELRERSHYPERYYGQPHFLPSAADSELLLRLNHLRTQIRQTELSACRAFQNADGGCDRSDLIQALNRLSSLCWILIIRLKAGKL